MSKKSGLGRGLQALINDENNLKNLIGNTVTGETVVKLDVKEIKANPYQPRKEFDKVELESLAESIKEQGLLQPIIVRKVNGQYELVAGERRLRAVKLAGIEQISALVRNYSNEESMNLALLENLQRTDLNPMEVATAYKCLMNEGGMTQDELSKKLGIKRSSIANTLRLLNLPEEVQQYVRVGKLNESGARALAGLPNFDVMKSMAQVAVDNGWSSRMIEINVADWKNKFGNDAKNRKEDFGKDKRKQQAKKTAAEQVNTDINTKKFMRELEMACGEPVEIVPIAGTKAKVIGFKFVTDEDLARVCEVFANLVKSVQKANVNIVEKHNHEETNIIKRFNV